MPAVTCPTSEASGNLPSQHSGNKLTCPDHGIVFTSQAIRKSPSSLPPSEIPEAILAPRRLTVSAARPLIANRDESVEKPLLATRHKPPWCMRRLTLW